ncbi:hypothetical protein M0R04_06230 [Candidatus Dojkabacteria bacterium]|jgi:hypothetical protein|nr:hypothetical protein [Candidatus Dojkabacteria bacterium]
MLKSEVIIYKIIRRASKVGNQVWCETNFGVKKFPISKIDDSIVLASFLEREKTGKL